MSKTYVIDTNVIISDPYCINKVYGKIIVPLTVLKELDKHKNDKGEKGRNIREFSRIVDDLIKEEVENVVFLDNETDLEFDSNDDRIIAVAKEQDAILITNDILMGIKAKAQGVEFERYIGDNSGNESEYTGIYDSRNKEYDGEKNLEENEYHVSNGGLFRKVEDSQRRLGKDKEVFGIRHRNVGQRCAIDALTDSSIKLVTISGKAGTGKTLLAIAAGLSQVIEGGKYKRILVSRPIIPMGNDIGFLPGDINDKLGPWMQPIFDNIDHIFNSESEVKGYDTYLELEKEGILKVEALTYIRGRSIPEHFIIIDEAQNLSKHEVKTIISRVGEDTKIILTGDPEQIDNPKLDSINNGLSHAIEKFKDQKIAAHITLTECERSELADIAAEIL